ncbi:MAG: hypothetical protein KDA24_16475 [Deltaproteobacteria bacterium]|nr:hypothetical protein [Deltaproteobacteria bacterium]
MQPLIDAAWRVTGPAMQRWARPRLGPDDARWGERLGVPSQPRPPGPLIWMHAASVGEARVAGALAAALRDTGFGGTVLATSFTTSGERILAGLPRVVHQYLPLDHPSWRGQFLDHWAPSVAVMLVAEIWPGLLRDAAARSIPLVLASAAPSDRSLRFWGLMDTLGTQTLRRFDRVLATDSDRARALSARVHVPVDVVGDLKGAAAPLPVDEELRDALRDAAAGRPVLLGACTHPGEEAALLDIVGARDDLFLILAPRHPRRADEVQALIDQRQLPTSRRTVRLPRPTDAVFLLDTLGELGAAYGAAALAFIGGSTSDVGGHSATEAARAGCPAVIGPDVRSNAQSTADLVTAGALRQGENPDATWALVAQLASDGTSHEQMTLAAKGATAMGAAPAQAAAQVIAGLLPPRVP